MFLLGILASWALAASAPLVSAETQAPEGANLEIHAEQQEHLAKVSKYRGYVVIRAGAVRLQADAVDYFREEGRVEAEGNVVFEQSDQKIVGSKVELNLATGAARFHHAYGTSADFRYYGELIEKESSDVYVIHSGAFSACSQPVPRWKFTSGKTRIRMGKNARLHNAFLKVKEIPVFYLPLFYYPINEEGRSTGFLLPRLGTSTFKGFLVSEAFFWAINRSMDATFNVDSYSQAGTGYGAEYRFVNTETSRGQFRTYFINDKTSGQRDYTLNYSLNQDLPGGFKAVARADYFSSFDFQQRYHENIDYATRRSKRASANVTRTWSNYTFRVVFDRNETSFGDQVSVRQVLPQLNLSSRPSRLFGTPLLFNFQSEASQLSRPQRGEPFEFKRFDVFPTISYPFTKLSFLTFRTSLSGRYTHYTAQLQRGRFPRDEPIDRRYYEVALDTRGPTFARIFDTPGNFYAERYKHVIEPQIVYSYRSRIDTFDELPRFDGNDYIPGTNQLAFSLVNRLFGKRKPRVPGGQSTPVEFLTWVLSQRYFFNIDASLYDPQFSTPFFSPDGTPSRYSPITSRVRFRPNQALAATWDLEYDLNFGLMRAMSFVGSYASDRWGQVSGAWNRRVIQENDVRDHLRGNAQLRLGQRIETGFELSFDVTSRELQHYRTNFTYNVQCCGFLVEYARFNFGGLRDEGVFRFGVTLANIGTFGNFLGGASQVQ